MVILIVLKVVKLAIFFIQIESFGIYQVLTIGVFKVAIFQFLFVELDDVIQLF